MINIKKANDQLEGQMSFFDYEPAAEPKYNNRITVTKG
jgi:hypothetical protein